MTVYETEYYLKCIIPKSYRNSLAKFGCGVAPKRVETGRYEDFSDFVISEKLSVILSDTSAKISNLILSIRKLLTYLWHLYF